MTKTKIVVTQNPEKPIEKNVLAKAIVEMSSAVKRLQAGGLNLEAIVVLTNHGIPPSRRPGTTTVQTVLESLADLEKQFTK